MNIVSKVCSSAKAKERCLEQSEGIVTALQKLLESWLTPTTDVLVNRLEDLDGARQRASFHSADIGLSATYTCFEKGNMRRYSLCPLESRKRIEGI